MLECSNFRQHSCNSFHFVLRFFLWQLCSCFKFRFFLHYSNITSKRIFAARVRFDFTYPVSDFDVRLAVRCYTNDCDAKLFYAMRDHAIDVLALPNICISV